MKNEQQTQFLSINEVAALMGVTLQTIRRWDKSGKLRSFRVNTFSPRKYRKEDVERFIQNNTGKK